VRNSIRCALDNSTVENKTAMTASCRAKKTATPVTARSQSHKSATNEPARQLTPCSVDKGTALVMHSFETGDDLSGSGSAGGDRDDRVSYLLDNI